jgi:phospholipid/cholesterol/gamma-HCH transport system substrate-binding protein
VALFRRQSRSPRDPGMSHFRAGLLALVVIAVLTYFGFTKANPFANPYELKATFATANNLKPRSPVRIAGVEVGKVTKVEPIIGGNGGAQVTMQIRKKGLPIHEDAQLKIRQRIFLEGNFFVDVFPGSPSAPNLKTGSTIPVNQTAAPVQFSQLLTALQSDTREDLKSFLYEYQKGLSGAGGRGFNDSIKYWESAYKNSSLANDASLGQQPTKDLQRVLKGQAKTFGALDRDEQALKDLVTNFNTTAAAFARQDTALERAIPALRDTLRVAQPALRSLNGSLPSLRAFARDALPGTRSSDPTLKASLPFITQARRLVSRRELRGTAAVLRRYIRDFVTLNEQSVDLSVEGRQLSACTNKVLVPFENMRVPDPDFSNNTNQRVREQTQRGFPGLSGESRLTDGNGNGYFHAGLVFPGNRVRPGPATDGGEQPPTHRPDEPCENQELPNLHAPGGPTLSFPGTASSVPSAKVANRGQAKELSKSLGQALIRVAPERDKLVAREKRRQKAQERRKKEARKR